MHSPHHTTLDRPVDLEGLLYDMRARIRVADLLADFALQRNLTEREETLAMAIMSLREDWDRFEAAVLENQRNGED